jgi:hypothetical protein
MHRLCRPVLPVCQDCLIGERKSTDEEGMTGGRFSVFLRLLTGSIRRRCDGRRPRGDVLSATELFPAASRVLAD